MTKECTIMFNEVEFVCTGNYYKGSFGDYDNPPEGPEFEVQTIKVTDSDINILDLFVNCDLIERIEELAIEALGNDFD
jgi:hypothetical protein